jgi:hypothetical protein
MRFYISTSLKIRAYIKGASVFELNENYQSMFPY